MAEAAEHTAATRAAGGAEPVVAAGLVIAVAGAMAHTEGAWHAVKVGVCQPLAPTADQRLAPQGDPDYCVGLESRTAFWPRLYAHAVAAGVADPRCQVVALIGDGAHGIWEQGAAYFGTPDRDCVEVLDFYHAAEHVSTVAHAVWGEGTPAAAAWITPTLHTLKAAGPAPLLAVLAALAPPTPAARAIVARATAYVTYHHTRMQYPTYQARGLPIGSGRVEDACKPLVKTRLSQSGMRWRRRGAQAVATLRALARSGHWDAFWATQPQRRAA